MSFKYNFKDQSINQLCYGSSEAKEYIPYQVDGLEDAEGVEDEDLWECYILDEDEQLN